MDGTTMIGEFEVHPAANAFPELSDERLRELYEDVKARGIVVPLKFYCGKLLDGRNRLRAWIMAGRDTSRLPREHVDPSKNPWDEVWSLNGARRDLPAAQRAAIRLKIDEGSGEHERLRAEIAERANRARAEKQAGVPKAEAKEQRRPSPEGPRSRPHRDSPAAKEIAARANVSRATVERVQKLKREDPEAFEALASGKPKRQTGLLPPGHALLSKRKPAKNWSVPRAIPALAAFLCARLTTRERRDLAGLLVVGLEDAA